MLLQPLKPRHNDQGKIDEDDHSHRQIGQQHNCCEHYQHENRQSSCTKQEAPKEFLTQPRAKEAVLRLAKVTGKIKKVCFHG